MPKSEDAAAASPPLSDNTSNPRRLLTSSSLSCLLQEQTTSCGGNVLRSKRHSDISLQKRSPRVSQGRSRFMSMPAMHMLPPVKYEVKLATKEIKAGDNFTVQWRT